MNEENEELGRRFLNGCKEKHILNWNIKDYPRGWLLFDGALDLHVLCRKTIMHFDRWTGQRA